MRIKSGDWISFFKTFARRCGRTMKSKVWAEVTLVHKPNPLGGFEYSTELGTVTEMDVKELVRAKDVTDEDRKAGRILESD